MHNVVSKGNAILGRVGWCGMRRYIDADELLNRLPDDLPYKSSVKRVLMQAPTADVVEVKHGEWKRDERFSPYCTACGEDPWSALIPENYFKYCPRCGAIMDGERRTNND